MASSIISWITRKVLGFVLGSSYPQSDTTAEVMPMTKEEELRVAIELQKMGGENCGGNLIS